MYDIYDCVNAFSELLDTEYTIIIGRKKVSAALHIRFRKQDCFHLMGLQYIRDRSELRKARDTVFDEIISHRIRKEQIEGFHFYTEIADRVNLLPNLEAIFDDNDTIFKYNESINKFSKIKGDYLMKNQIDVRNVFTFLSKDTAGKDAYYCRSFFPQSKMDYTKNQPSWTLLQKKKKRLSTGQEFVLYDRLS